MRFDDDGIRSHRVMIVQIVAPLLEPDVHRACCCCRSLRACASTGRDHPLRLTTRDWTVTFGLDWRVPVSDARRHEEVWR
jgi:hypothetical protein